SGSPPVAEDVTQEVFLALVRDGQRFDPARGRLRAFLFGIARHHVLRRIARERLFIQIAESDDDGHVGVTLITEGEPLSELARGQVLAAEARDRALAHAADCRRCAARFGDEQRLTAGLRGLAVIFNSEPTPARGEATLLAAFRAARCTPVSQRPRRWPAWVA